MKRSQGIDPTQQPTSADAKNANVLGDMIKELEGYIPGITQPGTTVVVAEHGNREMNPQTVGEANPPSESKPK